MADWLFIIGLALGMAVALYVAGWLYLDVRAQTRAEEREAWIEWQKGGAR